jgi:hypothetical protein
MFGWFRKPRTQKVFEEPAGEKFRPIRIALSTIDADVQSVETETFVAECAARISKRLCKASHLDLSEERTSYVAGIFAIAAADHLSRKLHVRFEIAASLALARLVAGARDIGPVYDTAVDGYYRLNTRKPEVIQGIAQDLASWIDQPTRENLECLATRFEVLRGSVSHT